MFDTHPLQYYIPPFAHQNSTYTTHVLAVLWGSTWSRATQINYQCSRGVLQAKIPTRIDQATGTLTSWPHTTKILLRSLPFPRIDYIPGGNDPNMEACLDSSTGFDWNQPGHPSPKRRPCDRCHIVKERCRWPSGNTSACERCSRLSFLCLSNRSVGKKGRKARLATGNRLLLRRANIDILSETPRSSSPTSSNESLATPTPSEAVYSPDMALSPSDNGFQIKIGRSVSLLPDLTTVEIRLLDIMLHRQIEIDKYIVGPSFREQHQQTFIDHIKIGMPLVKDAFIACGTLLVRNDDLPLVPYRSIGYRRAAAAVESLRDLQIHSSQDVSLVLIFGMAMVTFALHRSGGEAPLCRHVLGLVKPLHDNDFSLMQNLGPDGTSFLICLLGTEIMICILKCQLPSIRLREDDFGQLVDRFIGVSVSMLTHLYDVCQLAQLIHQSQCRRGNIIMDENIARQLARTENAVEKWQPSVPTDFLEGRFTPTEVVKMLTQAKVLRLAASLIIHRLHYAFGTYEAKAKAISCAILDELNLVLCLTGSSMPFVDLAFFVACLEIRDSEQQAAALERSRHIVDFSDRTRDELESWLISFWATMDIESHPPIYWDDIGPIIFQGADHH